MRQFVIKKTLRSILADEDLIEQIDKLSEDVSIIQFLASHHLYKRSMEIILSEDPVRIRAEFDRRVSDLMFKDDFFAVKANTVNPVADREFLQWMANQNPPVYLPAALHSGNALNEAMKMYKTNYSNNIKMRAKSMFRKYCKAVLYNTGRVWPKRVLNKLINHAVDWFFYFTTYQPRAGSPVQTIIDEFIWHMTIDDEDVGCRGFLNGSLDGTNFYRFAKYFIKMQLYVHHYNDTHPERNVKSFKVIPLHNYHRRCVLIDTETMRKFLHMHINKKRPNSMVNLNKSDVWSSFYLGDVDYKRDNQRFDFKISSDGVSVNIFMMKLNPHELHLDLDTPSKIEGVSMRPKDLPAREKFDQIPARVIERIDQFDVQIGIDPGAKTMAAWTKKYRYGDEECSSIESKTFREMFGFRQREFDRRSVTFRFDRREREAREASVIPITSKGPHYAEFVQHKLNVCSEGFVAYHDPYLRKLKFDAHQLRLDAMYKVSKRIIGYSANRKLNEALIFFGHWRWTANSPIHGIRTPLKLLRFCLQQLGSTVIVIHEHRTSKLCSFCGQTMIHNGRNSLCVDCVPIDRTLAPAAVWHMKAHKSYLKRHPFAPKIRTYRRDLNQPFRRNHQNHSPMNWNRDYNGSRAILSKGLDLVAGLPLPRNYLKTTQRVVQRVRFPRRRR